MNKYILLFFIIAAVYCDADGQTKSLGDANGMLEPPRYIVLKTSKRIKIDGKDKDKAWKKAEWTNWFGDIVSGAQNDTVHRGRCKMLWDKNYLYLYARLNTPDVWAAIRRHDRAVFFDNAFELFIDPDGDTHNYFEFQINAFGTTCDLFLPKPYHEGGQAVRNWTLAGLKKAIQIDGTLNKPGDKDKSWSVELAIPFSALTKGMKHRPEKGATWRMNFSGVIWKTNIVDGKYVKEKGKQDKFPAAHYMVWSPQGMINLHYPERWGYVKFSGK